MELPETASSGISTSSALDSVSGGTGGHGSSPGRSSSKRGEAFVSRGDREWERKRLIEGLRRGGGGGGGDGGGGWRLNSMLLSTMGAGEMDVVGVRCGLDGMRLGQPEQVRRDGFLSKKSSPTTLVHQPANDQSERGRCTGRPRWTSLHMCLSPTNWRLSTSRRNDRLR